MAGRTERRAAVVASERVADVAHAGHGPGEVRGGILHPRLAHFASEGDHAFLGGHQHLAGVQLLVRIEPIGDRFAEPPVTAGGAAAIAIGTGLQVPSAGGIVALAYDMLRRREVAIPALSLLPEGLVTRISSPWIDACVFLNPPSLIAFTILFAASCGIPWVRLTVRRTDVTQGFIEFQRGRGKQSGADIEWLSAYVEHKALMG